MLGRVGAINLRSWISGGQRDERDVDAPERPAAPETALIQSEAKRIICATRIATQSTIFCPAEGLTDNPFGRQHHRNTTGSRVPSPKRWIAVKTQEICNNDNANLIGEISLLPFDALRGPLQLCPFWAYCILLQLSPKINSREIGGMPRFDLDVMPFRLQTLIGLVVFHIYVGNLFLCQCYYFLVVRSIGSIRFHGLVYV